MTEQNELPERGPRNEMLYRIPHDTPEDRCRRPNCGAKVWWVKTKNNKNMIVDVSIPDVTKPPVTYKSVKDGLSTDGVGTPHWGQCADRRFVSEHGKARGSGNA